jgi:regulator of sigma E protease
MNLIIAFLLLFGLAFGRSEVTSRVGETVPGSPAQRALQEGDRILAVDGRGGDQLDFQRRISLHKCPGRQTKGCEAETPVLLRIERAGRTLTLRVRPAYDAELKRTRIGFAYATDEIDPTVPEAADWALVSMWKVTKGTVQAIVGIFDPEERKKISGVVGGYEVTRQAIEFDERQALAVLAIISLSLAVINLFPFLPLDGGHIFWSLVEKIRGRPVPFRVMEQAGVIGFMLVILLFTVGLSNDIGRLSGEGFQSR